MEKVVVEEKAGLDGLDGCDARTPDRSCPSQRPAVRARRRAALGLGRRRVRCLSGGGEGVWARDPGPGTSCSRAAGTGRVRRGRGGARDPAACQHKHSRIHIRAAQGVSLRVSHVVSHTDAAELAVGGA